MKPDPRARVFKTDDGRWAVQTSMAARLGWLDAGSSNDWGFSLAIANRLVKRMCETGIHYGVPR